jgi:Peptidase A4 family
MLEEAMEYKRDVPTLVDRIEEFPTPPEELDLLHATADQLAEYGLPPPPNPESERELYEVWRSLFVPRPLFVAAEVVLIEDIFRTEPRQTSVPSAVAVSPITRYETSQNWSGAYIEPGDARMFVQVSGRWVVPDPSPPQGAEPDQYACSTWVGLDGQRRYLDSSLPQIGTWQAVTLAADRSKSPPETYAWFQWWARDYPDNRPGRINGVPIETGDEVVCMVRVWRPSVALVYVKNLRTNRLAHFRIHAPVVNGHRFTISGATAEWVMERPRKLKSVDFFPLADYGSVEIFQCRAAEAHPGAAWTAVGAEEVLEGARFIRMYARLSNPQRTACISMPQRRGDRAVRISYGGFAD